MSEVCVFDLSTQSVRTVLRHEGHIEAPNWHPDGFLLVNMNNALFRVSLDAGTLEAVDTGPLRACNNDHGFSHDGQRLALSDKSESGQSRIFVLDWSQGASSLRRVSPHDPSWFHGWAPSGARIVYAAARGDSPRPPVAVFSCSATDGSDEQRHSCESFAHADGPEFSASGEWIWFNGERDGATKLWRVHVSDRARHEQMTFGPTVDWFPHASPNGEHVLFLRYAAGTTGHPAFRDVTLALMPQDGGAAVDLVRLHGGQGTINVPCWAPDSSAFAFVRHERRATSASD
jgi:Tol biopolymer transport system component